MISVDNTDYLSLSVKNRPFVGYHSLVPYGSITVSGSGGSESSAVNLWSPDTYTFSAVTTTGIFNIGLSFPGARNFNYVAIFVENLGDDDLLAEVERQVVSGVLSSALVPAGYKGPVIFYFDDVSDFGARIRIGGNVSGEKSCNFYHARAGESLILARPMGVGQRLTDKEIGKVIQNGSTGKYLGQVITRENKLYAINQRHNEASYTDLYIDDFLNHCSGVLPDSIGPQGSFFYCEKPEAYPELTQYCHAPTSVSRPAQQLANGMREWSISGRGE